MHILDCLHMQVLNTCFQHFPQLYTMEEDDIIVALCNMETVCSIDVLLRGTKMYNSQSF
jgi:hypothetical protein